MGSREEELTSRRRFVIEASAAGAALAIAGCGRSVDADSKNSSTAGLVQRAAAVKLPSRQFAWNSVLGRDSVGNVIPPRHHRLLLFDLAADPKPAAAAAIEAALGEVEAHAEFGPSGLLMLVGWGPAWFRRIGVNSPVAAASALSSVEAPRLDDYAAVVHLASDNPVLLKRLDEQLNKRLSMNAGSTPPLLRLRERRTGFVGRGLPLANQQGVSGLPADRKIAARAPMFMGFQSGLRRNQARESDIEISTGRWAGGTTMHVSSIDLTLDSWYGVLSAEQRVKQMFSSTASTRKLKRNPTGLANPEHDLKRVAERKGLVGHAESMASARRAGRPRLLRRDFNSVDGGGAKVHFVALQRTLEDFVATRKAMNAARAISSTSGVGPTTNNGINEWLTVTARGNYLVPPRRSRVCPGLPGWDDA